MWPSSRATAIAASSMTAPRAVLIKTTPGFILAISAAPINAEKLIEGNILTACSEIIRQRLPVVIDCLEPKRLGTALDCTTNAAHAENSQCLALRIMAKVKTLFEVAAP
ncbi:2-hydroxyacid dehydrogenase [Colletotrichum scovillei]|uniref:2-hydroxyacid dehydrogenase n=1 Tax=Colletotrichum scovillei TaxID=1209932 RepID=A0A9P7QWZ2_9PEZI|nr:2-hydroxyacid dehydrogenase [Colletotrichum scovillei]KAG7061901.1 2-hydroxyacid dehydrogenase [Colletotrichum scovillei]